MLELQSQTLGKITFAITLTPFMVLPLFATRFAAYAGGIRVSFIQPRLFKFNIKCSAWETYIIQTYLDEIYKHAFRVCTFCDARAFWLMNYCGFNIEPFCSDVCGDHRRPQTLWEICRNMGICCGFRAVADWEKYRGLIQGCHPFSWAWNIFVEII